MLWSSGQTNRTYSRSRADGLSASSHQRPGDGAHQRQRVLFGGKQKCALQMLEARCKFARACYLVPGEPRSTVRFKQRAFGGILCLLRSNWSLRWLDVCISTDPSEKCVVSVVREVCRELASEVGRVSERTRFNRSSRSVRARSRALRLLLLGRSVVRTSRRCRGKFGILQSGLQSFLSRGTLHNSRSAFHPGYIPCAESKYPRRRLLILSDNFSLVLTLCTGRTTFF